MNNINFLKKLKKEGKFELVEISVEIAKSYMVKAENCFKSASILFDNNLYENSVSSSYYAMYNALQSLLFNVGIKCENHTGTIIVFLLFFDRINMYNSIDFAKKERIDKQYYVASMNDIDLTRSSAKDMLNKAQDFIVEVKLMVENLNSMNIEKIRKEITQEI